MSKIMYDFHEIIVCTPKSVHMTVAAGYEVLYSFGELSDSVAQVSDS